MRSIRKFPIVQVVGYKGSGKTTLIKKLIALVTKELSLKVATLKHHGHGGEPTIAKDTDSYEHLQAGATISGVQGKDRLQLKITGTSQVPLTKIISLYEQFPIDLLLIEGYKQEKYPKIVLINEKKDKELLELDHIIAIGGWSTPKITNSEHPLFSINEFSTYEELFTRLLTSDHRS